MFSLKFQKINQDKPLNASIKSPLPVTDHLMLSVLERHTQSFQTVQSSKFLAKTITKFVFYIFQMECDPLQHWFLCQHKATLQLLQISSSLPSIHLFSGLIFFGSSLECILFFSGHPIFSGMTLQNYFLSFFSIDILQIVVAPEILRDYFLCFSVVSL